MKDEVKPISGGTHTQYCGWAATLIDSLDTLYIMGLYDEFDQAVNAVLGMSFTYAPSIGCSINPFEMTIRHLGGLIAAYDISGSTDERLKQKALDMGHMMFQAYGRNRIQCRSIFWPRLPFWPCTPSEKLSLARLGSQSLELVRLSMITGNPKFEHQSGFLAREMKRLQALSHLPGLWNILSVGTCPDGLCNTLPKWQFYSLGSGSDSAYEYLLKTHLLFGSKDPTYGDMWQLAAPRIKEQMLFQPMAPNNSELLLPGVLSAVSVIEQGGKIKASTNLEGKTEHLSCFVGGLLAISGKLYDRPKELDLAAKLTNGCVWAYASTKSGIAPDTFSLLNCKKSPFDCPWNEHEFNAAQESQPEKLPQPFLKVERRGYLLRPEAIESVFIMYRVTGDPVWRERGWEMFTAIRDATRTKYGHASLSDVFVSGSDANKMDKMESFWLSETLKYFYLLFAEPSLISLDEWVFNTEAHPFRLQDEYRGHG